MTSSSLTAAVIFSTSPRCPWGHGCTLRQAALIFHPRLYTSSSETSANWTEGRSLVGSVGDRWMIGLKEDFSKVGDAMNAEKQCFFLFHSCHFRPEPRCNITPHIKPPPLPILKKDWRPPKAAFVAGGHPYNGQRARGTASCSGNQKSLLKRPQKKRSPHLYTSPLLGFRAFSCLTPFQRETCFSSYKHQPQTSDSYTQHLQVPGISPVNLFQGWVLFSSELILKRILQPQSHHSPHLLAHESCRLTNFLVPQKNEEHFKI